MKTLNDKHFALRRKLRVGTKDTKMFAIGFTAGLAEKVHIGACLAAMVKPSLADAFWLVPAARIIARTYKLQVLLIPRTKMMEIWLCADKEVIRELRDAEASILQRANRTRARLCGIPEEDILLEYPISQ